MPIKNKKLIFFFYIRLSVFIKILNLGIPNLIISLSILTNYNYLVIQSRVILILGALVELCCKDNKRGDFPPLRINPMHDSNLFSISQLYSLCTTLSFCSYNNFYSPNYTYLEASLIKVIYILLKYPILCNYILYKVKLTLDSNQVLAL